VQHAQRQPVSPSALVLAERSVPRYTSYPTAPHFSETVSSETFTDWLWHLSPCTSLSIYLHVPFCAAMCAYCGCHTKVTRQREPIDAYIDGLIAEIRLAARSTSARRVEHIHWGGGTPSMLGAAGLKRVMDALSTHFDPTNLGEHAIELDPRSVTAELASGLAAIGITRASFGVQDLNPEVQRAIGRVQPIETVRAAVNAVRAAGITSINLDLMYGLPKQGIDELVGTILQADALKPDRIALFGYAHVPWFKSHQRLINEAALPDAAQRLEQAEASRELLEGLGYVAIGLDHFARPDDAMAVASRTGALGRNFQGYTTDRAPALIGLGASSISALPSGYAQNAIDVAGWRRAIDLGRFATVKGISLSADDRMRADIIRDLMCGFEVDLNVIGARHGAALSAFDEDLARIDELSTIATVERGRVVVTPDGRPFVRLVAAAFDRHLKAAKRHSLAV
jgi:oxygen-independent coproporphyrinogen-3 oxidase